LLLSTADFRRLLLGVRSHLYFPERLGDSLLNFRVRPPGHSQAVGDVLFNSQMREERVILKDCIHAPPEGRLLVESLCAHPYFAGGGRFKSGDDAEQRRFSRAAFSQDGEEFTFSDLQRHVAQHNIAAKLLGNIADA